jgi:hemoglobin-like flavoprotein
VLAWARLRVYYLVMDSTQIALVQATWPDVAAVADSAAQIFYARLFAINPEASALFAAADMRKQRDKLMITLNEIVRDLSDPERLNVQLEQLGQRHVAYGVRPEHYDMVGDALIWMLEKVLDAKFTPDVASAWQAAYGLIAQKMQA